MILQTRIRSLTLTPLQQYNPQFAIWGLEATKEVKAAVSVGDLQFPSVGGSWLLQQPSATAPHLPSLLRDITVDQALDLVAKTFEGMVIYGICAKGSSNRSLLIDFVELTGFRGEVGVGHQANS